LSQFITVFTLNCYSIREFDPNNRYLNNPAIVEYDENIKLQNDEQQQESSNDTKTGVSDNLRDYPLWNTSQNQEEEEEDSFAQRRRDRHLKRKSGYRRNDEQED
jgi:hypothetical protein